MGCELVLDGRPVHLVDNSFEGCVWFFEGAAGATLDALFALCRGDRALQAPRVARELGLPPGSPAAVAGRACVEATTSASRARSPGPRHR